MALGFKVGIVGIGECKKNMKVFGIGDVNSKSKNTNDMEPPGKSFNKNQRIVYSRVEATELIDH